MLAAYAGTLNLPDFEVTTARDGLEAMFKLKNQAFDLVITDIKMPRLTGDRMIEMLLSQGKTKGETYNIIIASGFVSNELLSKFKNESRVHFLTKPVSRNDLLEKVRLLSAA